MVKRCLGFLMSGQNHIIITSNGEIEDLTPFMMKTVIIKLRIEVFHLMMKAIYAVLTADFTLQHEL